MKHKLRIFFGTVAVLVITLNYFVIALGCGRSGAGTPGVELSDSTDSLKSDSLPYRERLVKTLDSLCTGEMFISSQLGLMVYDLDENAALYRLGEKQVLRPASTMKILTAVTALDCLGKGYRYRTELCFSGEQAVTALYGDLYIRGTMDPTLERSDIDRLADGVASLGVDTVFGGIVADRSFLDSPPLGRGWCWDDDNPALTPLVYQKKDNMAEVLRQRLSAAGVVVTGGISSGTTPEDAVLLAKRNTSLETVLMTMMKESDNLYAESVFYNTAGMTRLPATAETAQAREKETIRRTGLDPSDYGLADGSGLSQYNYLSAECEVYLLRFAYHDARIFDPLYRSLPRAGVDGTLKWRMRGTPAEDNVRAKTGTLTGVSTLAGYCTSPEGHTIAFAVMNQGVMQRWRAHAFQDAVCRALCE